MKDDKIYFDIGIKMSHLQIMSLLGLLNKNNDLRQICVTNTDLGNIFMNEKTAMAMKNHDQQFDKILREIDTSVKLINDLQVETSNDNINITKNIKSTNIINKSNTDDFNNASTKIDENLQNVSSEYIKSNINSLINDATTKTQDLIKQKFHACCIIF